MQLIFDSFAEIGEFGLPVAGHSEDGAGIDAALSEEPEDGVRDVSEWRYDESCDGECYSASEHGDGRIDLP